MLCENTYRNDKITQQINDLIGKPYSFFKSIQMKGTGSQRMMIDEVSNHFKNMIHPSDINYGSLEIRPNGVIFHISKGLQRFVWVIPYYKLVIFKSTTLSIHADGMFIKIKKTQISTKNNSFISKIIDLKSKQISDVNN